MKTKYFVFSVILTLSLLFLSNAQEKNISPLSLGVTNGNVRDYYPQIKIKLTYPQIYSSYVGALYIYKNYNGHHEAVLKMYETSAKNLLDDAKSTCTKEGYSIYGVSNFHFKVIQIQDGNLLSTATGDIFCADY
ncbi:hypothetical protein [Persephonella sp.]